MGISIRAYARSRRARGLSGGSDAAVRKALRMCRITANPDGTIDPHRADLEWATRTLPPMAPAVTPKEQRLLAALRGKARALGFAPLGLEYLMAAAYEAVYGIDGSSF